LRKLGTSHLVLVAEPSLLAGRIIRTPEDLDLLPTISMGERMDAKRYDKFLSKSPQGTAAGDRGPCPNGRARPPSRRDPTVLPRAHVRARPARFRFIPRQRLLQAFGRPGAASRAGPRRCAENAGVECMAARLEAAPPVGNKNAFRHGHYSAEAVARRRELSALIGIARDTLAELE
jgi:hypothetical protein